MENFFPKIEKEILKFWRKNDIFNQTLKKRVKKEFTFFDGPPFASGLPHYGHIVGMGIKDAICRYWTMKGWKVQRRAGWDCHGLPIELEIENQFKISGKKEIEEKIGIKEFNQACKKIVLRYAKEWEKTMERMGRWINFQGAYKTMDQDYIETIWWVFKQIYKKGLIYQDFKTTSYCPRCQTPLSNFEVNQGYRDNVEDPSVFVKFEIRNTKFETPKSGKNYFLVWTTTPWTLPGNVALAVGEEIDYVKVRKSESQKVKENEEYFILARERLSEIKEPYEIVEEMKGKDLAGIEYQPLFQFTPPQDKKAFYVVSADLVSFEEGTGIVHIAPAYGEEDFELGKEKNLPIINLIDSGGKFISKTPWPGKFIKAADGLIIKDLENRGLLYRSEKIYHTYPFCWRCEAPVYDWLLPSWFIKVTKIRDKLIKNNQKIYWMPDHLKNGRFGKWLEGARDWNISRNRYWGAPIPVWICQKCSHKIVIGSIEELKKAIGARNKFYFLRHGQGLQNVKGIISHSLNDGYFLTEKGKRQILKAAQSLKSKKIDLIFASDLDRTKQTAELIAKNLGVPIFYDPRLRELNIGIFNGKTEKEYMAFKKKINPFISAPEGGENLKEVQKRMLEMIREINSQHYGKNILIISHGDPLWVLKGALCGFSDREILKTKPPELAELFTCPVNEIDLHRPYIDEIKLICPKCGAKALRTPEILDCWFESGSMPLAQAHFPFAFTQNQKSKIKNQKDFRKLIKKLNFPADFIAEGIDQTRGWFYTLNVISTILLNQPAFKNVIVNGLILAEDGKKMSKRLKNYPEPEEIFSQYGADALRFYLFSSPAVKAESLCFQKKQVAEKQKTLLLLYNVLNFYKLYPKKSLSSRHILDQWILSKLNLLIERVSQFLDQYDLLGASREIEEFISDLSLWYLRRSRERLKNESGSLNYVLKILAQIISPLTPFLSEYIWQELKISKPISVHLTNWPKADSINKELLKQMKKIRQICQTVHSLRKEAKIKVRQPIASLKIRNPKSEIRKELLNLIKEELNVKEVEFVSELPKEKNYLIKENLALDIEITRELKEEGICRDLIRQINNLRKKIGLSLKDKTMLYFGTDSSELKQIIKKYQSVLEKETGSRIVQIIQPGKVYSETIMINEQKITINFGF